MKNLIALLLVIGLFGGVEAKTVAWWPMTGTGGAKVSATDGIKSRGATDDALTAYPASLNNALVKESTDYFPFYSELDKLPDDVGFLDPVTGETYAEPTVVKFPKQSLNGWSGLLRVTKPAALRLQTFTFEMFFRRGSNVGDWQVLAVMPAKLVNEKGGKIIKNCDSWGLRLTEASAITVRFTDGAKCTFADGADVVGGNPNTEVFVRTPLALNDGRWHHLAFTAQALEEGGVQKTQIQIFADYQLVKSQKLGFPIWYGDEDLFLGANLQTPGPYDGDMAQVRVSDEVLTPGQFLTMTRTTSLPGEDPDVFCHYDFEAGDMLPQRFFIDGKAGNVQGWLVATNTNVRLNNALPTVGYRTGIRAEAWPTNAWALSSTYNGENRATKQYVQRAVATDEDTFATSSFTVECCYRIDSTNGPGKYEPLVRRRGGSNVQFNLGFSEKTDRVTASCMVGNNTTMTLVDTVSKQDREWHHAAMVFDRENRRFVLYSDYQVHGWAVLTNDLVSSTYPIFIAGTDNGNAFRGFVDNVRITKRALRPDEFLTCRGRLDATAKTIAWVTFDETDDAAFGNSTNSAFALDAVIRESGKATGGNVPARSDNVRGPVIMDGDRNVLRETNAHSAYLNASNLKYVANPTLARESAFTVELFVKADGQQPEYAPIVRCSRAMSDVSLPVWAMSFGIRKNASTSESSGKLRVRCSFPGNEYAINQDTKFAIDDGKWHHVALAMEPATVRKDGVDTAGTKVSVWVDYSDEPQVWTYPETIDWGDGMATIYVGRGVGELPSFAGWVDELRISRGVLEPRQFLRARKNSGMIVIVR